MANFLSSPHDSSWSGQLGHPCQNLNSRRNHSPAVPHLRLAVVHPDVGENLFFQNLVDVQHPFKSTCHIDVVEECTPSIKAFLEIRSYAPTPSMDTTVARLSRSEIRVAHELPDCSFFLKIQIKNNAKSVTIFTQIPHNEPFQ